MRRRHQSVLPLLVGAAILASCSGEGTVRPPDGEPGEETGQPASASETALALCFPGGDQRLHVEGRVLADGLDGEQRLRAIVAEVLAGPREPGLVPPFPPEVQLREAYLTADRLAYIDLGSAEPLGAPPASGSTQELVAVYSLVNSVALNLPEVTGVVLLWNGVQRATFAGHLDTASPLRPKPDLIARMP